MKQNVKVALIQTSPVLFDREGTLVKVRNKTEETSAFSPDLILFPEAFVPAYPDGLTFGAPVGSRSEEGRELWLRYWKNSIEIPGPDVEVLSEIARMSGTFLAIGVIEKENIGKGSLYCTLLYFGPDGNCWVNTEKSSLRLPNGLSGQKAMAARLPPFIPKSGLSAGLFAGRIICPWHVLPCIKKV